MEYLLILIIAIAAGSGDDESKDGVVVADKPLVAESALPQNEVKLETKYHRNEYGYIEANLAYTDNGCKTFIVSDLDSEKMSERKTISVTKVKVGCNHEK